MKTFIAGLVVLTASLAQAEVVNLPDAVASPDALAAGDLPNTTVWDLSADFSGSKNPNGAWAFGSKPSLGSSLKPYTDTTLVPSAYHTSQLAGWSDPSLGTIPYVLKNVSNQDWLYDGRSVGGGLGVLAPQEILVHPDSQPERFSVVQWTAPENGLFALDVRLQRFEQVEGRNSNYFILQNGVQLPGATGVLVGFQDPRSSARYTNPSLSLKTGDTIQVAVGFGLDGTSGMDGTIVRATMERIPEPSTLLMLAVGAAGCYYFSRRKRIG